MTYRALELLNLPPGEPAFLLDIGCGSGLSGEILDEEGYVWAGVDIAPSMLGACVRPAFTPLHTVDFQKAVLTWKARGCARTRGRR
jgi:predicted TPR repeat methyltransferase